MRDMPGISYNVTTPHIPPAFERAYQALCKYPPFKEWRAENTNSLAFWGPTSENPNCTLRYSTNPNKFANPQDSDIIIVAVLRTDGSFDFLHPTQQAEQQL